MAAEREITFRLRARDESGAAFESLKDKATGAGQAMGGVVSKDLGDRLNHFNSTGAKAASILGQIGGKAGEAASHVTRFGGVISSLLSRTTLLEAGLIGIGVGIVALGSKLIEIANGPMTAAVEALDSAVNKSRELRETIDAAMLAESQALLGVTENEKLYQQALENKKRLLKEIFDLETARLQKPMSKDDALIAVGLAVQDELRAAKLADINILHRESSDLALAELAAAKAQTDALADRVNKEKELAEIKSTQGDLVGINWSPKAAGREKIGGRVLTEDYGPSRETEEAYERSFGEEQDRFDAAVERERLKYELILDAERMYYAESEKLAEDNFELQKQLSDAQLEHEKEVAREKIEAERDSYQAMNDTIGKVGQMGSNLIGVYEKIAVATAKSEKEAAKHRAIAAALLAALKIGEEIAYAASSFAHQDYFEGALHIVAAAMWATQAATANQQGGGGGGAAAAAPAPGPQDRQYWADRKESGQTGNININISGDVISGHSAGEMVEDLLKLARQKRNPTEPRAEMEV